MARLKNISSRGMAVPFFRPARGLKLHVGRARLSLYVRALRSQRGQPAMAGLFPERAASSLTWEA